MRPVAGCSATSPCGLPARPRRRTYVRSGCSLGLRLPKLARVDRTNVVETWSLIVVAPALFAGVACVGGVRRAEVWRPDWKAIGIGFAFSVAVAALVFSAREPGVESGPLVFGVILAGGGLGAIPAWAFFAIGRSLAGHRVALPLLFVLSLAALYVYCTVILFGVLDLVTCPPDSYECPL